ncbi:hypothetical protein QBK99_05190 [Corticibacterium sp. UT-5YL-CI-8]|nr:hypothetical protein [Tianweitania sp. UT-5YL-CI-8]
MLRFLFRLLATTALSVATIMAVLDATRSVASSRLVFTPLASSWEAVAPGSFAATGAFIRDKAPDMLWDPVALWVLALPGFVVFLALAFLFYAVGYNRQRRRIGFVTES